MVQALALPGAAGATIPSGSLVVNPGAEIGPASAIGERRPIPGWTTFNPGQPGYMAIDYLPAGDPGELMDADDEGTSGCRAFFGGGPTPGSTAAVQIVDVSTAAAEIDSVSGVMARMTARVGRLGGHNNHGQVKFEFLPAFGEVASQVYKLEDDSTGASRLKTINVEAKLPTETRRIAVRVLGIFDEEEPELENTGYVDDVGLTLDGSDPAAVTPTEGCKGGSATTGPASEITAAGARVSGVVNPGADFTRYRFEYGTTSAYGLATPYQGVEPRLWEFTPYFGPIPMLIPPSADLSGLVQGTTYHYRIVADSPRPGGAGFYAAQSLGTDATFTTLRAIQTGHPTRLSRSISISYVAAKDSFRGKIASPTPGCRRGKVKVFRVRKGPDPKVASGKAGANGKWTARKGAVDGRYYATTGSQSVDAGACPAVKSRVLKLG
jgi:hypothetical protein